MFICLSIIFDVHLLSNFALMCSMHRLCFGPCSDHRRCMDNCFGPCSGKCVYARAPVFFGQLAGAPRWCVFGRCVFEVLRFAFLVFVHFASRVCAFVCFGLDVAFLQLTCAACKLSRFALNIVNLLLQCFLVLRFACRCGLRFSYSCGLGFHIPVSAQVVNILDVCVRVPAVPLVDLCIFLLSAICIAQR